MLPNPCTEKPSRTTNNETAHRLILHFIYARTNRPAAAKPLLLEVIDSAPVDGAAYATLRKILFDEGANQKAQQLLERAIQLEPENVDAILSLAEAMLKLAKNPELRLQMGQNGRKKVLREFDEKIVIQKTVEIYKKAGSQFF